MKVADEAIKAQVATPEALAASSESEIETPKAATTKEDIDKLIHDRRRANKEAIDAKKANETLAAKLKAYEDNEKTDADRAIERAEALQVENAQLRGKFEHANRVTVALSNGVSDTYKDFVAQQLAMAEEAEGEGFDPKAWLNNFKQSSPAFFSHANPAAASGAGGPSLSGMSPKVKRVAEIDQQIKTLSSGRRTNDIEMQLFNLRREKKFLAQDGKA
jgi:hypothetical protein